MRHQVRGNRLNRPADHKRAMLRNMVTSLFAHERIETTITKAKEARRYAERMITFAKRGDLHARRQAARFVNDPKVLQKLFTEIGPRFADRPGGYTRVIRTSIRKGDDAQLAILELVTGDYTPKPKREKSKPVAKAAPVKEEAPAEETAPEATEEAADDSAEGDEEKQEG